MLGGGGSGRATLHLLLCGSPGSWDTNRLTAVRSRYAADILAVHHLTREAAPGVLYDLNGQAFRRLGVTDTAHFLVRPDGHIGYRVDGTDLDGLHGYLDRWLPNSTPHPA